MRTVPVALAERLRPAAETFANLGFEQARLDDLTAATGIPISTLYYYFDGKQEILAFILADWLAKVGSAVAAAAADVNAGRADSSRTEGAVRARDRLAGVVRAQLAQMAAHPATCRILLAELGRIDRLPNLANQVREVFLRPVAQLLVEGALDGSLRRLDPEVTASAVYGAVTITGVRYVLGGGALTADEIADRVLSLILDGIAPRASDPGES